jgi:hypothetical protein
MLDGEFSRVGQPRETNRIETDNVANRVGYREKIMQVLQNSPCPMDVENVRLSVGMKNWESTKSILLEMVLQGSIRGQRTARSWLFWVEDDLFRTRS